MQWVMPLVTSKSTGIFSCNYPNAQGGFIWDWIDQSVSTKVENTTTYTITDPNTGVATKFDGKVTEGRNNTKAIQGT